MAEGQRAVLKKSSVSFDDYLRSLDVKFEVNVNNVPELARLSQLTEKTNQFNFNKEIFTISSLENFIKQGNLIYSTKVSDKFGNYGTVGLILAEMTGATSRLRNYLMSCRVLGRSVEQNFFQYVLKDLEKKGRPVKEVLFKNTPKNTPAKEFYLKYIQHEFSQ